MAYLDAGTGSMLIFMLSFMWLFVFGWIANIVGLAKTPNLSQNNQGRFVLHIVGIFMWPLGSVVGLIWFFSWRKQSTVPPPPPSSGAWAPPAPPA
jgi:hypothetical protein